MLMILLILIFFRPFISSLAYLVFPYENFTYSILLFIFLILWVINKGVHFNEIKPIKYPILLFLLSLAISLVFSQNIIISIEELYPYITGLLLLLVAASLTKEDKNKVILCMIISGLFISFLALHQYLFGFKHLSEYVAKQNISDPFLLDYISRKRVFFPFVTPNVLGGYLAMVIPLALNHKNKILFIIPLLLALLLTQSISALLALLLGMLLYFSLQGRWEKKKIVSLCGLLVIIGLVLIFRITNQKQHLQPSFSAVMRLNYWRDTIEIIKAFPVTGVGLGNFNLAYSRYAHNSYLQIWAEMGILGVISILWLIVSVYKSAFMNISKTIQKTQLASLIAAGTVFLVHNFLDFTFFLPQVAMLWWVILGLIISKDSNELDYRHTNL